MSDSQTPLIATHFVRQLREQPLSNALVLREDGAWREVSWRELARDVWRTIRSFREKGIVPGDRIVQVASNSYRWVVTDFACQFSRAVHVPVNPKRGVNQIAEIVSHCEPALVIDESFDWEPLVDCNAIDTVMVELGKLVGAVVADELMSILYTSGTTGEPKGVMLGYKNFASNVRSLLQVSPVRKDETRICFLSLSHVFARTNDLYAAVAGGCTLAIVDGAREMFRDLAEIRPTFFNGVPYLFEKVFTELQRRNREGDPISLRDLLGGRIEAVNCGGAAIDPEIESCFWRHGVPMLTGYGLTETSPVVAASSIEDHQRGSVGKPLRGVRVRIANDDEVLVSGENVTPGYFRNAELTADAIRDGWLRTGDLGRIDEGGFLHIIGRKKEMIVTSTGRNIFPAVIEKRIDSHSAVVRSCVVGDRLPFLIAIVELAAGTPESLIGQIEKELQQATSPFAAHEQPGACVFTDEPFSIEAGLLTEKGSLRRCAIRKRYDESLNQRAGRNSVAKPDN